MQKRSMVFILILFNLFSCIKENTNNGKLYDSFTFNDDNISIRINALYDYSQLVTGGLFQFEYKEENKNTWKKLLEFRFDDPINIPKDIIKKIDHNKYYFYIGWIYAVSVDGGNNWIKTNILDIIPKKEQINYKLIKDVYIFDNGIGTMELDPIRVKITKLNTDDYGISWKIP
jgi:hypothetical protein